MKDSGFPLFFTNSQSSCIKFLAAVFVGWCRLFAPFFLIFHFYILYCTINVLFYCALLSCVRWTPLNHIDITEFKLHATIIGTAHLSGKPHTIHTCDKVSKDARFATGVLDLRAQSLVIIIIIIIIIIISLLFSSCRGGMQQVNPVMLLTPPRTPHPDAM